MGSCSDTCGASPHCAGCPFKPKFGCCELLDGTDSCARTAYFAAVAIAGMLPNYGATLGSFIDAIRVVRDVTECANCLKDFFDLGRGELFQSESGLENASEAASLGSSVITPLPILVERGFVNLGNHVLWIAPLTNILSATGHGLALAASLSQKEELQAADSSCECLYQVSELVNSICPKALIVTIGVGTGSWKFRRTLQKPQEVAPAA